MTRIRLMSREGETRAEVESNAAVSLLNALLSAGLPIRHDCGGKALCGTCAVRVISGAAGISPMAPREAERLATDSRPAGFRLACQARAARDIDIEIPTGRPVEGERE
jgi:ferredoxin